MMFSTKSKPHINASIDTLFVFFFNKVIETQDTGWLYDKYREATDESNEAWSNILRDYTIATSHRSSNMDLFDLSQQMFELTVEFNNVNFLCNAIRLSYSGDIAEKLEEYGHLITSEKDVDRVSNQNKNRLTQRRDLEIRMHEMLSKKTNSISFEAAFDRICDHKKIRLNPREITVKEWIAIEDNYISDLHKK